MLTTLLGVPWFEGSLLFFLLHLLSFSFQIWLVQLKVPTPSLELPISHTHTQHTRTHPLEGQVKMGKTNMAQPSDSECLFLRKQVFWEVFISAIWKEIAPNQISLRWAELYKDWLQDFSESLTCNVHCEISQGWEIFVWINTPFFLRWPLKLCFCCRHCDLARGRRTGGISLLHRPVGFIWGLDYSETKPGLSHDLVKSENQGFNRLRISSWMFCFIPTRSLVVYRQEGSSEGSS